MVLSFVYWSLRRLLELMVLRRRSEREKEIEILLLRHQRRVLERQVARPTLTPGDRVLLAAFSRVLARRSPLERFDPACRIGDQAESRCAEAKKAWVDHGSAARPAASGGYRVSDLRGEGCRAIWASWGAVSNA